MEANMTELRLIVESLQLELVSLRENVTSSADRISANVEQLDMFGLDLDTMWLMVGSVLVVFMQAGFAMLEVGSVSDTHTKDILIKNLLDLAIAAVMWWSIGWGIAFGGDDADDTPGPLSSNGEFFAKGQEFVDGEGYYGQEQGYFWALWLFQWSFSGTTVTIVSGAVGARITMVGYVFFAQMMVGFIYPVVARWGWSADGWASPWSDTRDDLLFGCGAIDFAGSGIVHTTGGVAALVMIILLGPRINRFSVGSVDESKRQQSTVMQVLGAFLLWVGWYGFNGCSTLYLTGSSHVAAKAMACTTISAAAAGLGVTSASLVLFQHVGTDEVMNGLLSGLVSISACCAVVELEGAFFIGLVSAVNYLVSSRFIEMVHIDDMVDASPVHLSNGIWGVIAAGLLTSKEAYSASYYAERQDRCCGLLYGCGPNQLMANLTMLVVIIIWAGSCSFLVGYFLKYTGSLRISKSAEMAGTEWSPQENDELPKLMAGVMAQIKKFVLWIGYDVSESDARLSPTHFSRSSMSSAGQDPR